MNCPSCGRPYDAEAASDCKCLDPVRSFTCPHCAGCFCSADRRFIEQFWAGASPALWQRRRKRALSVLPDAPGDLDASRPIVLFADDDPTGRRIAQQIIRSMGCNVVLASDGEELLERAMQVKPELVIADALMPKRDGRDAAAIIKAQMPATRVVIITSLYKDARYRQEAISAYGVDEYLSKPIAPGKLRELVQRFVLAGTSS